MELDTGAAVSNISALRFKLLCPGTNIKPTSVKLKTYSGEILEPLGTAKVQVQYENQQTQGEIFILSLNIDTIFGRDWLRLFQINWEDLHGISLVDYEKELHTILKDFDDVLTSTLRTIPGYAYSLKLADPDTQPIFIKPRPVPYALRPKVEDELKRLEHEQIIEKVVHSCWGAPIVPVVKKKGSIRILCADFKFKVRRLVNF